MARSNNVEAKLLGADAHIFSLNREDASSNLAHFTVTSPQDKFRKVTKVLNGVEAMEFLGLPNRPLCYLTKGDASVIKDKFEALFREWNKRNYHDGNLKINEDAHFWSRIKVRVWKKQNIERFEFDGGAPVKVVGQQTAGCPTLGIEGGEYTGDLMDGKSLTTFLSEYKNSERPNDYFVQLERIEVTEDMEKHA